MKTPLLSQQLKTALAQQPNALAALPPQFQRHALVALLGAHQHQTLIAAEHQQRKREEDEGLLLNDAPLIHHFPLSPQSVQDLCRFLLELQEPFLVLLLLLLALLGLLQVSDEGHVALEDRVDVQSFEVGVGLQPGKTQLLS